MSITLNGILQKIGSYVDQDTTLPTGTDLTTRVNLVNRALNEWADTYEWKQLRRTYSPTVLLSMVSVGLPSDFKRLMGAIYDQSITSSNQYVEIRPEERFIKLSSDKYVVVWGDPAAGTYININPALGSGASIVMDYQSYPSSLATLQDVSQVPHPEYLAQRAIAYILESRSDSRFPSAKADADRMLQSMIEEEAAPTGGQNNRVPDYFRSNNFRVGRD